jgi:transcriptional regulator with PAS, ATPase and Fis domain
MNTDIDLHQLVECVGDAIIVANAHEKIVLWNPAATRIFGYLEEEALGNTLDLIVPERQRQKHNEGYSHSMETGTTRYGTSLLKVPAKQMAKANPSGIDFAKSPVPLLMPVTAMWPAITTTALMPIST